MNKSVFNINTPNDCLYCEMRACLHIDGKPYQFCGLQVPDYGYETEAFFKEEDLKIGWISPKCPLINEEDFIEKLEYKKKEEKIKEILTSYSQIDGSHHKAWCLDQIARIIYDNQYNNFIDDYCENGEYKWDCGIAP